MMTRACSLELESQGVPVSQGVQASQRLQAHAHVYALPRGVSQKPSLQQVSLQHLQLQQLVLQQHQQLQ